MNCKYKLVILSILFTSNNVIYSITDISGDVLFWTSLGFKRIKGTKKMNTTLLISVLKKVKEFINSLDCKYIFIKVKGFNKNKKFILKLLKYNFPMMCLLYEKTSHPHNGCKKMKKRRV